MDFEVVIYLSLAVFLLLGLLGTAGYKSTKKKAFAIVAIVGYVLLMPIGLIGAFYVRKLMDRNTREEFEARRGESERV